MAASGTIRAQGTITGFQAGPRTLDMSWVITNGVPDHVSLVIGITPTSLVIAAGARACWVFPPAGNTTAFAWSSDPAFATQNDADLTMPLVFTTNVSLHSSGQIVFLKATGSPVTVEVWAV